MERSEEIASTSRRAVPRGIDLTTDVGDLVYDASRGLVVDDADRFDLMTLIVRELRVDNRRIDAVPPVARHELDLQAHARRHLFPERGEMAGLEHQDLRAWRQRVDERRFPRAGS